MLEADRKLDCLGPSLSTRWIHCQVWIALMSWKQTRPLFICGNARGGTTLLLRLLDGHPDLLVLPTETQVYPALATRQVTRWLLRIAELVPYRRAVDLLSMPAVARLGFQGKDGLAARVRAWAREYPFAGSVTDEAVAAAARTVDGPHQYWDTFLSLFCQYTGAQLDGKSYWVEKTPAAERFAGVSDRWTGRTARFLHVVRDPRDYVASTLLRGERLGMEGDRTRTILRLCFI